MAVSDWSTTPSANTFLGTYNLQTGATNVADLNNIIQELMAQIAAFAATVPNAATLMPKSGGIFTGPVTFQDAGHILYNANPLHNSGKVHTIAVTDPAPVLADGDRVERF